MTNATRTGPIGAVSYQIEVASDEAFTSTFATWTVAEQANQTSFDTPKDLAYSKVYDWHVRASDPNDARTVVADAGVAGAGRAGAARRRAPGRTPSTCVR